MGDKVSVTVEGIVSEWKDAIRSIVDLVSDCGLTSISLTVHELNDMIKVVGYRVRLLVG